MRVENSRLENEYPLQKENKISSDSLKRIEVDEKKKKPVWRNEVNKREVIIGEFVRYKDFF